MLVRISHPGGPVKGRIHISGSKSISNRALILSALCAERKEISNLSDSDDTQTLRRLLLQSKLKAESNYDAHHAGTTFRFMTAYLAMQEGVQILTGSERMQQRPIGPLVDALNEIGADISYEKKSGYPPLRIGPFKSQEKNQIEIRSDISSQFLSSLCMIAPTLEKGLTIRLRGQLVSKPYLEMTLKMMETYGVLAEFDGEIISIKAQPYQATTYFVESDWSSASYFFSIAALAPGSEITLSYFTDDGLQADAAIQNFCQKFGVEAALTEDGELIIKHSERYQDSIEHDFILHPDLTQTIAAICAAKGISIKYRGLKTLYIKETDRVAALRQELRKTGVTWAESKDEGWEYIQHGKVVIDEPIFDTYEDHRMAMCLAPLGYLSEVSIRNPEVVSKSYPRYWDDLESLGFKISYLSSDDLF